MKLCISVLLIVTLSVVSLYAKVNSLSSSSEIFNGCAKCHGRDGLNPAFGTSEPIAGQPEEDLIESMNFFKESQFKGRGVILVMARQVKYLSQKQITDLATYISNLNKVK